MTAESTTAGEPEAARSITENALEVIKGKGLKYSLVSVVNVVLGQGFLFVFSRLLHASDPDPRITHRAVRGAVANTIAVVLSAIPAYYMSRAWVWGKRGKSELRREVLPFWIFVAIGWFFSTIGVALIAHYYPAPEGAGPLEIHKLLINVVSIGAFGVLWVIRFFWMDKAFHLDHHHAHGPFDVLLDEDEPVEPDPVG